MPLRLDEWLEPPARVNERASELDWAELLFEYERALDDVAALLAGLSDEQLHFEPAPKSCSISDVITHALNSDQLLWRWVKLLAEGRRAEIDSAALALVAGAPSARSGAEIAALIETVKLIGRGVIELRPDPVDLHATAPHPHFGELNAKGWVMFMALQHGRSLRQCEAVIDTPGFPRGVSKQSLTVDEYLQPRDRKPWLTPAAGSQRPSASKRASELAKKTAAKQKGRTSFVQ